MTTTELIPTGARWVRTGNYNLLEAKVSAAIDMQGICAIDGPYGAGKTSGTTRLLNRQSLPHITIQIDEGAADGELIRLLLLELNIRPRGQTLWEHKLQLAQALQDEEVIIRLVEAQFTPLKFLRQLRTMHDRTTARWTWVLEGKGIHRRANKIPELKSRMSFPVTFQYLNSSELVAYLRKYHPMYAAAPVPLLRGIDRELSLLMSAKGTDGERGCLRYWTGFTFALLRECDNRGLAPQVSAELASLATSHYAMAEEYDSRDGENDDVEDGAA